MQDLETGCQPPRLVSTHAHAMLQVDTCALALGLERRSPMNSPGSLSLELVGR
jgi:hypothetical protein